ncbi:hypothetical protein [Massilia suwonensis]|uniref:Uncharacterized protein n=1 Tax=Massilia suwonensis TaxID=648895 RepID=A0ABW0MKI4_9BURK
MNTQKQEASNTVLSTFATSIKRLFAHDATSGGSDLLQLYLLSRGSDSVRPAVIRKLRAAAQN